MAEISDGFHPFPDATHTCSRWIPYGMSSWNHNPTLILYHVQGGFHMEWLHGIKILHLK